MRPVNWPTVAFAGLRRRSGRKLLQRVVRRRSVDCSPRLCALPAHQPPAWDTGSYVANRVADKISMLAENVYICRSGSVRTGCQRQQREAAAASAVVLATEAALQARAVQP